MHPKSEPEKLAQPGPSHRPEGPETRNHSLRLLRLEKANPRAGEGRVGAGTVGRQEATHHLHTPPGQRAHVRGHSPAVVRVRSWCRMATAAAAPAPAAWLGHPCGLCSPGGGGCSARHRRVVTVAPGWEVLAHWSGPGLWVLFALGRTSSDAFRSLGSLFSLAGQPQRPCKSTLGPMASESMAVLSVAAMWGMKLSQR